MTKSPYLAAIAGLATLVLVGAQRPGVPPP